VWRWPLEITHWTGVLGPPVCSRPPPWIQQPCLLIACWAPSPLFAAGVQGPGFASYLRGLPRWVLPRNALLGTPFFFSFSAGSKSKIGRGPSVHPIVGTWFGLVRQKPMVVWHIAAALFTIWPLRLPPEWASRCGSHACFLFGPARAGFWWPPWIGPCGPSKSPFWAQGVAMIPYLLFAGMVNMGGCPAVSEALFSGPRTVFWVLSKTGPPTRLLGVSPPLDRSSGPRGRPSCGVPGIDSPMLVSGPP